MSKTFFVLIVNLLILTFVGGVIWFFFFYDQPAGEFDFSVTVSDFLPFGRLAETTDESGPEAPGTTEEAGGGTETFGALKQLVPAPVAGFTVLTGTSTALRYIERATGHIYDLPLADGKSERITNTTIPRIHEALFAERGKTVLIRYLRDDNATIETYSAKIPDYSGAPGELKGIFLTNNIRDIVLSPDGKKIFYLASFGGGTTGFTASTENSARVQVFSSLGNEWLSSWTSDRAIALATKPSGGIDGYLYTLDPVSKSFEKLMGKIPGLTALPSPDGKWIFYGSAGGRGMSAGLYDIKNRATIPITLATIPDKCVWESAGSTLYCGVPTAPPLAKYPDSWYQGFVLFSDRLWRLDPISGASTLLVDPRREAGVPIDAVRLSLSNDGNHLFFINKKDQSLWSLDLTKAGQ